MDEIRSVTHFAAQLREKFHLLRLCGRGLGESTYKHQPSQWLVTSCLWEQRVPHRLQQEYEDIEDEGTDAWRGVGLTECDKSVQNILM